MGNGGGSQALVRFTPFRSAQCSINSNANATAVSRANTAGCTYVHAEMGLHLVGLVSDLSGASRAVAVVVTAPRPIGWRSSEGKRVMLSRRLFANCALCATIGLVAS